MDAIPRSSRPTEHIEGLHIKPIIPSGIRPIRYDGRPRLVRLTHDFRLRRKLRRATGEWIKGAVHEKCIEAYFSTIRLSGIFHAHPVLAFRSDVSYYQRMVRFLVAPVRKSKSLGEPLRGGVLRLLSGRNTFIFSFCLFVLLLVGCAARDNEHVSLELTSDSHMATAMSISLNGGFHDAVGYYQGYSSPLISFFDTSIRLRPRGGNTAHHINVSDSASLPLTWLPRNGQAVFKMVKVSGAQMPDGALHIDSITEISLPPSEPIELIRNRLSHADISSALANFRNLYDDTWLSSKCELLPDNSIHIRPHSGWSSAHYYHMSGEYHLYAISTPLSDYRYSITFVFATSFSDSSLRLVDFGTVAGNIDE